MEEQQKLQGEPEQVQDYRPCIQNGQQRVFDNLGQSAQLMSIDQCESIGDLDDSQLVGAPAPVTSDADLVSKQGVNMVDTEIKNEAKVAEMSTGKRKRGRPPRIHAKSAPVPPSQRKKRDEEDVCFICFDGGSLVLCDRRGCPKAYHPACIKRDESFFRSKAKWNCGWHICISCQKASHYMCYTCTFSLCKGCTKDADYSCVRGNKGFCGTCMRTIILIENIAGENKEMVQVDFDDKTSWEYLFKVYWIYLKSKLSLTLDELTKAKNPWRGDELLKSKNSLKDAATMARKGESLGGVYHSNNESNCNNNCENLEACHSKRRKPKNLPEVLNEESYLDMERSGIQEVTTLPKGTTWATKELLEFVAHMKNGDVSGLSHFDVQALLLEYIKINNLRDPRQKCQIVCDSRLMNLFGKERVGHFEMMKLLEYHFLSKENYPADKIFRAGAADIVGSPVIAAGNNNIQLMMNNGRRRKTRKMIDETRLKNVNLDEYAAVDVHNINLLYLKRSLVESLMDDSEKFHENVVGSFVRIRISGGDQKQDMHRLVEVVGTSKAGESYKVGTRKTDIMLEILNLDKKELIPIDGISDQEFSEDECRRLRQSIKCGLIKRLTVGEIQQKAMVLQAVKVNDWLEAEILRLNHLRDRASEKGHRKELRECVEKLEVLKSPIERQRRVVEILNVHTDPNMDPSYVSEEDSGESGDHKRPTNSGIGRKGATLNSPLKGGGICNDVRNMSRQNLSTACEQNRNMCTTFYVDSDGTTRVGQGVTVIGLNSQNTPTNLVAPTDLVTGDWNSQVQSESLSGAATAVLLAPPTGREPSLDDIEIERRWHYQDPTGKIQGPFSMMQLRKWSTGGLFPPDLRVWLINEKQDDSILLVDALVGRFHKEPPLPHNSHLHPQGAKVTCKDTDKMQEHELSQNSDAAWIDSKKVDNLKLVENDASVHCDDSVELGRRNGWGSFSSSWAKALDVAIASNGHSQSSLQGWELSKRGKSSPDQPQMCSSQPIPSSSGELCGTPLLTIGGGPGDEKWTSGLSNINEISHKTTEDQTSIRKSDEKLADNEGYSSQSSGQNWRPPPINSSSGGWNSDSGFVSVAKSTETSKHNGEIEFSDLPSPKTKQSQEQLIGQAAENKRSVSPNAPVLDSGPSWSTASSLVVGGLRLPEIAGECVGYCHTPPKPSAEERDSNLVSASSLRPTEGSSDHAATPTSGTVQATHCSRNNPAMDESGWQPIVPEPNDFCSLADESVSDLLAAVEAMESLGGLPSPTSKMRCDGELPHGSDNDCFSPAEEFSPAPDIGRSDELSSTGTVANEPLQLSHMPSQPTVMEEKLGVSQMPYQLTVTNERFQVSPVLSRSIATAEQLWSSQMASHSTFTDESIGLPQNEIPDPQKSFSGHSSTSAEVEGDTNKPSDVSVNQLEAGAETQPPESTINQAEGGSDTQPSTPSTVSQWEAGLDTKRPTPSRADGNWGTVRGNDDLSHGVAQGNTNMIWGTGHGTVQQHGSTDSAASTTGNPGSWGSQARYGGDRFSGQRDHRNHIQGRDSALGRDRSLWNNRQLHFGVGNGGGSFRPPPKGQRVCKFYESGYCKKGASCRYWHP